MDGLPASCVICSDIYQSRHEAILAKLDKNAEDIVELKTVIANAQGAVNMGKWFLGLVSIAAGAVGGMIGHSVGK